MYIEERRGLTRAQVDRLRQPIPEAFVEKKQGMSYIAQHEVRAELTRIFGYGNWDSQVESMEFLFEYEVDKTHPEYPQQNGQPKAGAKPRYYRACYKASVRLNIRDYWGNTVCSFVEHHVELNSILPDRGEAHAMAVTSAESYALRRAAIGLGDRLGLGLYNDGKTEPLVKNTLQMTDPDSPLYKAPDPKKEEERTGKLQAAMNVKEGQ